MAEEFDLLTYVVCYAVAGLFVVLYGALTTLGYKLIAKKDHEARQDNPR